MFFTFNCNKNNQLVVLQWNCRSLNRNVDYLVHYISQNQVDILCVQSPCCRRGDLPKIDGYYYPPVSHGHPSVGGREGTVTYIKSNLNYTTIDSKLEADASICSIEIKLKNKNIKIHNIYYPAGDEEGEWLKFQSSGNCLVVGDFNKHSALWEDGYAGVEPKLGTEIMLSEFILLNDGTVTRVPDRSDQRGTAIDLALVTPDLIGDVGWTVGDDPLSSDHLPITITFNTSVARNCPATNEKFNYNKADWSRFRAELGTSPIGDHGALSVNALNSLIIKNILTAARLSIPTTKMGSTRTHNNPWWSAACGEAVKRKRYYYKKYRQNCTEETHGEMTKAKIECKKVIAQAKLDHWNHFVGNLDDKADLGAVYKEIKKIKQQYCLPDSDLREGDRVFKTKKAKADAFAEVFSNASSIDHLPAGMREYRDAYERNNPLQDPAPADLAINCPLTHAELETALTSITKLKVSEGPDLVSYRMLRELPETYMEALLALFRRCWEEGVIPDGWKHAIVTPIPKHGKSRKEIGNYRPISLTSHIGKIYERILKRRLNHFCESKGVIPVCQAGFRTGRGVSDHLVRLGAHVRRARMRRRALYSCFFDVRRAYDTVWHRRLLEKSKKVGLSGRIFNFLKAFLRNRTFQVRWRDTLSNSQRLDMGVLQGSVIAPLLFSIMLSDIDKIKSHNSIITLYADDLAVWKESKCRKFTNVSKTNSRFWQIQKHFQEVVSNVEQYMAANGFSLSAQKTVFIIFGPLRALPKECSISVCGERLYAAKQVKYLGVTFQRSGSVCQHIKNNIQSASRAVNLIKMLIRTPWANHPKTMITLVKSLVRSRLYYGLEACYDMPASLITAIEQAECRAIKLALGLPRATPRYLAYREAGMLPATLYIKLICAKYRFRSQSVNNSVKEEVVGAFGGPAEVRFCVPFRDFVQDLVQAAGVEGCGVAQRPIHPYPPWVVEVARIELEMAGLRKVDDPHYIHTVCQEVIEKKYSYHLQIYTDGSKMKEGVGASFVIPEFKNIIKKYKLPNNVSVFTAELVAILMALNFINDLAHTPLAVVIFSDSLSALQSIKHDKLSSREDAVKEIVVIIHQLITRGTAVTLQWVPSHVGLTGNERADRAAKQAADGLGATEINLTLSFSDIKSLLTRAVWGRWAEEFAAQAGDSCYSNDLSPPCRDGVRLPSVSAHLTGIIYRLRCNVWKSICIPKACPCGQQISPFHILFKCSEFQSHFKIINDKLKQLNLPPALSSVCRYHEGVGWGLAVETAKLIYSTSVSAHI